MALCKSAIFLVSIFFVNLYGEDIFEEDIYGEDIYGEDVRVLVIPVLKFEALKTGGFQVYIHADPQISLFVFHGSINSQISYPQPGEIHGEVTNPKNGYLILKFDNHLQIGYVIYSWASYATDLGPIRQNRVRWNVTELLDSYTTDLNLESTQPDNLLFEDNFDGSSLNTDKWKVEHRIPTYAGSSYEFNSYENRNETCFVKNGKLHLKPIARQSLNEVRGTLDLREGCTSTEESQCLFQSRALFLLPPVKSVKVTLKTPFKYGRVEIRAKLPAGDWIFPIIQLEPKEKNGENLTALWIAYSRGNDHLTKEKADIGARLLFAGPLIHPLEPARSKKLITRTSTFPYNNDFHVYTLDWAPGKMTFFYDGEEYGNVSVSNHEFADSSLVVGNTSQTPGVLFDQEYVLSLGVGVGGFNDFPDYFKSGDNPKPWVNWERNGVKKFFDARNAWLSTWNGDDVALQVDYVKIWPASQV